MWPLICWPLILIKRSVATKEVSSHYSAASFFAARPCFIYFEFLNLFSIQWGCRWFILSKWVGESQQRTNTFSIKPCSQFFIWKSGNSAGNIYFLGRFEETETLLFQFKTTEVLKKRYYIFQDSWSSLKFCYTWCEKLHRFHRQLFKR